MIKSVGIVSQEKKFDKQYDSVIRSIFDGSEVIDLEKIEDPEVRELIAAIATKVRLLFNENEVLKEQNLILKVRQEMQEKVKEALLKDVYTDGLTKVNNRKFFDKKVKEEVSRAVRYGHNLSLLFMDVDKFKSVNDTYGHPVGDKVLKSIARIIGESIRDTDIVCRYGGEEFVVILPETSPEQAIILAKRISNVVKDAILARSNKKEKESIRGTVSIGIAGIDGAKMMEEFKSGDIKTKDVVKQIILEADNNVYLLKGEKQFKNRESNRGKIAMGLQVIEP